MILSTKLSVVLLLSALSQFTYGQNYSVHNKNKSYLSLIGGVNFSLPKITDRYSVLTSNSTRLEKDYDNIIENPGAQFGIRYSFNLTNSISLVGDVAYQSVGFKYFTNYSWTDTVNKQEFNREMHHVQKISYFTVPLQARWEITNGQLKPYIQGGVSLDFRHQAKKIIHYDNTIDGEETDNELASSAEVSIKENTRKFNLGLTGGVGLNYYTKYVTFGLEGNVKYGLFKVISDENRYSDLNGFALKYLDVFDQFKMVVLNVQLSVSVPLNNSISTNILRRKKYYKRR